MLIFDMRAIGNKLHEARKRLGFTQQEVAEKAELSDRTYADIERGNVNMRIETFLKICNALQVTPDAVLTEENASLSDTEKAVSKKFDACSDAEKRTALKIIDTYLSSL